MLQTLNLWKKGQYLHAVLYIKVIRFHSCCSVSQRRPVVYILHDVGNTEDFSVFYAKFVIVSEDDVPNTKSLIDDYFIAVDNDFNDEFISLNNIDLNYLIDFLSKNNIEAILGNPKFNYVFE